MLKTACLSLALALALPFAGGAFAASPATAARSAAIDIPHQQFVLPNGLTVIVHEDRKAPVVNVAVWYRVGSKNEPAGKTGFAHLFEHLLFNGSEHHPGEYFEPFEQAGVTEINGQTGFDRTIYYETVPTTALDMALWMESDRMGHLLGAIDQKTLDEQRGVVQNEKRQREGAPYARSGNHWLANVVPANHPYNHSVIGSMEDLNAASLEDVKRWFRDYYGAANAVLVLAGDIDAATAKAKAMQYFGDIPAGKPVSRPAKWTAARETSTRLQMEDAVSQVRIKRSWNIPARGDRDLTLLDLAADVLGSGKTSRLYQRLVYQDQLVDSVSASVMPFELVGIFNWQADVKQGVDPAKVEAAIDEEMQKFLAEGPTAEELARYKAAHKAKTIRSLERVSSKASLLADSVLTFGGADGWRREFDAYQSATPSDVQAAAKRWLSRGDFTLTVVPAAGEPKDVPVIGLPAGQRPADIPGTPTDSFTTTASGVDRSKGVPEVERFPDLSFPQIQRGKLKNGIEVVLAARHGVPLVDVALQFDAGNASDAGYKPGTASFTTAMLDEGTATLDSVQITQARELLGMNLSADCELDACTASANMLRENLAPSLRLLADVVRNPAFRDADIERLRAQWLASIAQEKTRPMDVALLRLLQPLLFGEGHPYAVPVLSTAGNEVSIAALDAGDLRAWQAAWLRPDNVRIVVAGDTTLPDIVRELDGAFGDWQAPATPRGIKRIPEVAAQPGPRVFLIDKPGAQQSTIVAGALAPPASTPDYLQINTMNGAFGGAFTSRLNMNLREDKHWSYGAGSDVLDARGQRSFALAAPVQTDKTAESVAEVLREARDVVGKRPLEATEIAKVKASDVRKLPGTYETVSALLDTLAHNLLYDRPDDYVATLKRRIEAQTDDEVRAAAARVIRPEALTWVIVGDLSKIEAPIRALNLGEVTVIDTDGKPVAKKQ